MTPLEMEKLGAISIHTLAWRVTHGVYGTNGFRYISIHTLAWRVTLKDSIYQGRKEISIHTLAWRVT